MIGVVTHSYPNGSFTVFFAEGQFGAKGFAKAVPEGERFEAGDRVDCEFSATGKGTVIRAVRVAAERRVPKADAGMRTESAVEKPFVRLKRRVRATGTAGGKPVAAGVPQDAAAIGYHVK